jgi:hypothetical protein
MKRFHIPYLNVCLIVTVLVFLCAGGVPVRGQSVTWQILPFPDSNWPGPFGQPATTNGGLITLQGQPVRTVQSFSGPIQISYDVVLPARTMTDGGMQLYFIPQGFTSTQISPNLMLYMTYANGGQDSLQIVTNGNTEVWGPTPFTIVTQTVYHVAVDVSGSGGLTWIINNTTNAIPNTVKVPFGTFQLEMDGWQPGDTWKVSNFSVVPEPATMTLVLGGLMGMGIAIRRHRSARR